VENISKYYLSEGYFVYVLSKVAKILDVDVEEIIRLKINKVRNKTDIGFLILASSKLNKELIRRYEEAEEGSLELFQHPRLSLEFSCPFLDFVVRRCAEIKVKGVGFDEVIAKTYNKVCEKIYTYNISAKSLIKLLKKYRLEKEKLVELGVGTANLSRYLLEKGYNILGIDISKEMLNIARKKTKDNMKAEYLLQDVGNLKIKPVKAMYSHNFIDFRGYTIEIWAKSFENSLKMLKSVSNKLQKNGFLFIHKKEDKKKDEDFELINRKSITGHNLLNVYIYQDEEIVMRRIYEKIVLDKQEFQNIMDKLSLRLVEDTELWEVYRKFS
jgi:SAM-dependent methyltransferase